jgi:CBS domain-containing protein
MAQTIQEVMTTNPLTVDANATTTEIAQVMRDNDIGDVIVTRDGEVQGIVTDRDIVVRALADHPHPDEVNAGEIASRDLTFLHPTDSVSEAVQTLRDKAVRRLPVIDERGRPVGIVSLGDLAMERDPDSVLSDISAAPPNS